MSQFVYPFSVKWKGVFYSPPVEGWPLSRGGLFVKNKNEEHGLRCKAKHLYHAVCSSATTKFIILISSPLRQLLLPIVAIRNGGTFFGFYCGGDRSERFVGTGDKAKALSLLEVIFSFNFFSSLVHTKTVCLNCLQIFIILNTLNSRYPNRYKSYINCRSLLLLTKLLIP